MYRDGLEFAILGEFVDHDGFDGVMLGNQEAGYHLEFTSKNDHSAGRAPTKEHLLVFYLPNRNEWSRLCKLAETSGFEPVNSFNPYWDHRGKTFEDLDGYRIVLQNADCDAN